MLVHGAGTRPPGPVVACRAPPPRARSGNRSRMIKGFGGKFMIADCDVSGGDPRFVLHWYRTDTVARVRDS